MIGDLAFGESFGGLEDVSGSYHPWVVLLMETLKVGARVDALLRIPIVTFLLQAYLVSAHRNQLAQHRALAREKVQRRMALQIPRHDLAEAMITRGGGKVCLRTSEWRGKSPGFDQSLKSRQSQQRNILTGS